MFCGVGDGVLACRDAIVMQARSPLVSTTAAEYSDIKFDGYDVLETRKVLYYRWQVRLNLVVVQAGVNCHIFTTPCTQHVCLFISHRKSRFVLISYICYIHTSVDMTTA